MHMSEAVAQCSLGMVWKNFPVWVVVHQYAVYNGVVNIMLCIVYSQKIKVVWANSL